MTGDLIALETAAVALVAAGEATPEEALLGVVTLIPRLAEDGNRCEECGTGIPPSKTRPRRFCDLHRRRENRTAVAA